jgi:hypothetical protein
MLELTFWCAEKKDLAKNDNAHTFIFIFFIEK